METVRLTSLTAIGLHVYKKREQYWRLQFSHEKKTTFFSILLTQYAQKLTGE